MSVLKARRTESKAEFVNKANEIYIYTMKFLTKLSSRYARLIAADTMHLASEVLDHAEKANSIFPSSNERIALREQHLLEARASLMALDVHLTHCYSLMIKNVQGCFTKSNGDTLEKGRAERKLENLAQTLGELVDAENSLLTNVLKSDSKRKQK